MSFMKENAMLAPFCPADPRPSTAEEGGATMSQANSAREKSE